MNSVTHIFSQPLKSKVVLIDGLIFQFYRGAPNGISRVWLNLIPHLQRLLDDYSIVVLRRGQFTSGLPSCLEYPVREYDFSDPAGGDKDTLELTALITELDPVCFISTYYSRADGCPNILLLHDMIPEIMKEDLSKPSWVAKKKAILAASRYITVSDSTRRDLQTFYAIDDDKIQIAPNGVTPAFQPAPKEKYGAYLAAKGITNPYLLLVGGRGQYKGAVRFLNAFSRTGYSDQFQIVAVGGEPWLTREEENLRNRLKITYTGWISDKDLILLYSGAFALVYPSLYEGFGLPVAEAMACGCPVILPHHSSLPEVAGDSGTFADPGDKDALEAAIDSLMDKETRLSHIQRGIIQARKFRWSDMASVFADEVRKLE